MTHKRRVLHILQTAQFAGTEAHVLTLMQALRPLAVQAELLCRPGSPLHERAIALGLTCHTPGTFGQTVTLLRREPFDILHAHDGSAKLKSVLAACLAASRARVVATQHFVSPAYTERAGWKGHVSKLAHRMVNRAVCRTIAISDAVRDAALARAEVAPARIVVVPNGITLPVPASDGAAKLSDLGIAPGAPLVCTVARLSPEKGLTYLLRAVPAVQGIVPDARFLILGDGAERPALEAEAARLGVQNAVVFAGFRDDVADFVARCAVFVLPSPAEPFGLSLVEAMSLARPTVATRAGGPLEIVRDGETGLLVAPADADALANATIVLLTDPVRAARMGLAGQARMQSHFTADAMARRTEAVYAACAPVSPPKEVADEIHP